MVAWVTDGLMAGYSPLTHRMEPDLFHFATPGSVDLNGNTRLNYPMGAGIDLGDYPNNLNPRVRLNFTTADFTANGSTTGPSGKKLSVGMKIVRANHWPEGYVPTPKEIFDSPSFDWAQRSTGYVWGTGPAPPSLTWTFDLPMLNESDGWYWNTKWWILLYPSVITNTALPWSKTNDAPIKGSDINVVGRAISFWSNHVPGKPVITSPVSGTTHAPGAEFALTLNPADPDELTPTDTYQFNADVAGVQYQYRAVPGVDNPDPPWSEIPFDYVWEDAPGGPQTLRGEMWEIRGSRYWGGDVATAAHEALVSNLGASVVPGAGDDVDDRQPGKGALPTGDWQIRARTFDFGHPYPNDGHFVGLPGAGGPAPGPLGINPATTFLSEPAKDSYPVNNTSPWSDPIRINIPTQVPPPTVVSPANDLAVSGNVETVRLRWKYRNTHQPPRDQYLRTVQIREVGALEWSTVFDGIGADPYVDLPFSLVQGDVPPMEILTDPGFESNITGTSGGHVTVDQWEPGDAGEPGGLPTLANINNSGEAHAGSRYLKMTSGNPTDHAMLMRRYTPGIPEEYVEFTFDGWVWIPAGTDGYMFVQIFWLDADGATIDPPAPGGELDFDWPYFADFFTKAEGDGGPAVSGWTRLSTMTPYDDGFDRLSMRRHPDGVTLVVLFAPGSNVGSLPPWRVDDLTLIATGTALDSFALEIGHHYEWRVAVTDTDGVESGFSAPARFWVVAAGASGEIRPVPATTIEGAELGCGTHRVEIFRRGGKTRVGELTQISKVDWGRVRDDYSTAEITISGWDVDCGNLLKNLQTWAYEIVIHRDNGYSTERVWEGPITLITYENDKVTIDAKDVIAYIYRRIIRQAMSDAGTGNGTTVVDRARRVIQNCLAPDDPNVLAYLQVISNDNDAMQYRSIPAYSRTGYEEVDDMAANAGLDYTAVGRSILLWGTKNRIGLLPEFRDENLGASPIVSEYGMEFANRWAVSDGNGVYGVAERLTDGQDPIYGLVEKLSSTWASDSENDTGTYTQEGLETVIESFEGYAERSIADNNPPPVIVRVPDGTTLNPNTPISIQHLVPGVAIPLRSTSTLRTVVQRQKLDSLRVIEEKGKETIAVTLSPFLQDDAGTSTEGTE